MKLINTTRILWIVYFLLLMVLLPHTANVMGAFEPSDSLGALSAWAGAFAFECAIAVLTHKLAEHIEHGPKRLVPWQKFSYRYLNAYSFGLLIAVGVSSLANLAHAVEFGRDLAIFAEWGIRPEVYQFAFGAILPVTSLLFARVLSNVSETEDQPDPELEKARAEAAELRKALKEALKRSEIAEAAARQAETRFAAAGDIFAKLLNQEKRVRVMAARQAWPKLPAGAIAIITETSPSYVSEILNGVSVETEG